MPNHCPDGQLSANPSRPAVREEIWDRFMDALDRAGQAGNAADVLTPTALHPDAPSGKRFGDLTRVEVGNLATIAQSRRGDAAIAMWQTQQKLRARKGVSPRVNERPKPGRPGIKHH